MKIAYQFANGEKQEIEVEDGLGAVLLDLDRQEYNNDHRETRRHASLDGMDYEGGVFAAADDPAADAELRSDMAALARAIATLSADQRALLHKVYFENRRVVDIARKEGVSEAAIRNRLKKIYACMKKSLK